MLLEITPTFPQQFCGGCIMTDDIFTVGQWRSDGGHLVQMTHTYTATLRYNTEPFVL